jgi:hypothetical protein
LSERMFPTYPISARRRVSTTRVAVTGPYIPHLALALAIIVGALPANMLLFAMGACMYTHTYGHMHTFRPIPFDLFLFSCRASHFRICTYSHANRGLPTGSGESGKSTIVKQMKIIHQNGYSREELLAFRPLIWKNLLESGRDVVQALAKLNLQPISPSNKVR